MTTKSPERVASELKVRLCDSGNLVVTEGRLRNQIVGVTYWHISGRCALKIEARHRSLVKKATGIFGQPSE